MILKARQRDIPLNVTNSYPSRYDDTLPEHYASQQDQNERSQFLPSIQRIPNQRRSWPAAHAVYVHPSDQNLKGKFNIHTVYADDSAGNRSYTILGFRRRIFYLLVVILMLIALGAILGGILGSKAATESGTTQSVS